MKSTQWHSMKGNSWFFLMMAYYFLFVLLFQSIVSKLQCLGEEFYCRLSHAAAVIAVKIIL